MYAIAFSREAGDHRRADRRAEGTPPPSPPDLGASRPRTLTHPGRIGRSARRSGKITDTLSTFLSDPSCNFHGRVKSSATGRGRSAGITLIWTVFKRVTTLTRRRHGCSVALSAHCPRAHRRPSVPPHVRLVIRRTDTTDERRHYAALRGGLRPHRSSEVRVPLPEPPGLGQPRL